MFRQQLRAILRASAYGKVRILIPMVAHIGEIKLIFEAIARARQQLDDAGRAYTRGRSRRDDRDTCGRGDDRPLSCGTSTSSRSAPTT